MLSKTTYLKGLQCLKLLYLNKHLPAQKTPPGKETLRLFEQGKFFEKKFKNTFADAFDNQQIGGYNFSSYPEITQNILNSNLTATVFEAGFKYNDVLVLTDVLQKNDDGSYTIFEVKLYTALNDVIIDDLRIQYWVCKSILGNIQSFNVVLRTIDNGFNIIDLTQELNKNTYEVEQNIEKFKTVLNQQIEPVIEMGGHCDSPYVCEFKAYCLANNCR
jgi:hypothetical protein